MNKIVVVILTIVTVGFLVYYFFVRKEGGEEKVNEIQTGLIDTMRLISSAFEEGGKIPTKYTCDGDNFSPPLSWEGVPSGTKSYVLIVDDPDVPRSLRPDGMFVHWVMWNIPAATASISENSAPEGAAQGLNGTGRASYTGPCPPDREHRYFFKLYALDTMLDLLVGVTKEDLLAAMQGRVLAQVELIGKYERVKK